MTNNQTIVIFIALILYLVGLGFLFNAIGNDLNIKYTETGQEINGNFVGNIVTGIEDCPIWLNTIFIIIPVALLIWLAVLLILHG